MTTAMKRLVGVVVTVWSIVLPNIPAGLSQPISVNTQKGDIGERVSFTVQLDRAPKAVSAFGFDVAYDSTVLQYTGTFSPEDVGRSFEFFGVNEPTPGRIRVGGFTTKNQIEAEGSGRIVTLEFTVIGPGNAAVSLANMVDGFTGWPAQSGSFEGVTQASSVPTAGSAPQSSSAQIGSGTPQPSSSLSGGSTLRPPGAQTGSVLSHSPHMPIGGSTPRLSSTPTEGGSPQSPPDRTPGMSPQSPSPQTVRKPAVSTRDAGALTSPPPESRQVPAGGKPPAPKAEAPAGSAKTSISKPETATAIHGAASRPVATTAAGAGGGEADVRYGASPPLSPVNTFFSGAAFIGVIFTLLLQRRELRLQRAELKCMRLEWSHTAKLQDRIGREFRELTYHSLLAAKLHALNGLLQVQKDKISIANLQQLSHANGSSKAIEESSESMATGLKEIEAYVSQIEQTLKKC